MDEMILWGAAGHAKVLRECMADSGLRLIALFDRDTSLTSPFGDVALVGDQHSFESWLDDRRGPDSLGFLVAIGGDRGFDRIERQEYLQGHGLTPLVARHRTAFIADTAQIGPGSQVLAHASVGVDATIGRACIINTGAVVDHDCRLADGVHIAPGARLTGEVVVGTGSMIGAGAVVIPRVRIGSHAVVGAGAVVVGDVADGTTVVGNPAKPLSERRHE